MNVGAETSDRSKILIVDDVSKNIQVAANILQKEGYQMAFAQDGPTAISQTTANRFDLVLLDIMMPEMDGFEVCTQIRQNPANRDIPIIFLTAKNDSESVVKGFEFGAMDYVTKPFNGAELLARVKTHLDLYHSKMKIEQKNEQLRGEIEKRVKIEEELRSSREKYRDLAIHDNLTGLYNTRYLYHTLEGLVHDSDSGGAHFSLIFMDMDNFKRVVDTHGHLNGSRALAEVAQTIKGVTKDIETAYGVAYGGDEFVVVLPGCDKDQAMEKAEKIRRKMLETVYLPYVANGEGVHLQASFGVSTYPDDAVNVTEILAKADQAMFHIKAKGKNAVGKVNGKR